MSIKNYRYIERRNMMLRRIGYWVGEIAGVVFLAYLLIHFCFQVITVHGESMEPTYHDGDIVFVNKLGYRLKEPQRLDAALLEIENGTAVHYTVKRIIGLPGESVQIAEGKILVDGNILDVAFEEEILSPGLASYEVELGEDEYFVMGDNCNNSEDSRVANIGNIKRTQFIGKLSGKIKKGE